MEKMPRVISALFVCALLTGCEPPYYQLKNSQSTAKIRVIGIDTERVAERFDVAVHANAKCENTQRIRMHSKSDFNTTGNNAADLGMRKDPSKRYVPTRYVEFAIDASRQNFITVTGNTFSGRCISTVALFPQADHEYEIEFEAREDDCLFQVFRIIGDNDTYQRVPAPAVKPIYPACRWY